MSLLGGAVVQKADVAAGFVMLRVRSPGETAYVILLAGRRGGIGLASKRPLGGAAFAGSNATEKAKLRSKLDGARVVAVGEEIVLMERAGAHLVLALDRAAERVVLRDASEADLAASGADEGDREALEARGAELVTNLLGADRAMRVAAVSLALTRARSKIDRRVEAIRGDLARIGETQAAAVRASAFVAEAARAPRGARSLSVTDWSSGEERVIELPLDPARSAREQLDAIFRKARRIKLGAAIGEKRLAEAEAIRDRVRELLLEVESTRAIEDAAVATAALDRISAEARAAAPRDVSIGKAAPLRSRGREKPAPRLPYRAFTGAGGARILVGRGGADNDALTAHHARPHDLWLHAKGRTGAHVIVPLDKGKSCPPELLVDAAHLAAHFSEAREETIVEVQSTPRRHLQKPRGAAPGLVVVQREKVLVLRVDRARLAALLAAELA